MKCDLIQTTNQQRLLALDRYLRKGCPGYTRVEIITRLRNQGFEVSLRTFNRDLDRLRDLDAPIKNEYRLGPGDNSKKVGWFYADPSWTLSKIPMTEGTLFALLVSQRAMEQYSGLPVVKDLRKAFETIADSFTRKVCIHHDTLVPISFSPETSVAVDPAVWSQVASATMKHRRLRITYKKGWGNDAGIRSRRDIAPYHIVNLQGAWYLLGSASYTDVSLRQYALSRIIKAEMLDSPISIPDSFDIKKILDVTFGQFIGDPDKAEEVHVRFNKQVAPLVMSRKFSAREKKDVLVNGDIDLRFPASAAGPWPFYQIKSWVLAWGADVKVLGPESLKTAVQEEIRKMADQSFITA